MAHPYYHALSSAKRYGGYWEDYYAIHSWFDETKAHLGDVRHRALRHHTLGIFEAQRIFGPTITNSDGKEVPTRFIAEQHVLEDMGGRIPTVEEWLRELPLQGWMAKGAKPLSVELNDKQPKEVILSGE